MAVLRELRGIYAITPEVVDTATLLALSAAALRGGVRWLQYRYKGADAALQLRQAQALRALTREYDAGLIINDHLPLALAVAADGVHLGRDDGNLAMARAGLDGQRLLGASCYASPQLAQVAVAAGADYVAMGAVFPSSTKPDAVACPLAVIGQCKALGAPVVAIGGITTGNAGQVVAAGADMLAVSAALFAAVDVTASAQRLCEIFARNAEMQ